MSWHRRDPEGWDAKPTMTPDPVPREDDSIIDVPADRYIDDEWLVTLHPAWLAIAGVIGLTTGIAASVFFALGWMWGQP